MNEELTYKAHKLSFYRIPKNEHTLQFGMYLDFDRSNCTFYHNFFFDKYKFVLKIALTPPLHDNELESEDTDQEITKKSNARLKLERFDLTKYVYLLYYD